MTNELTVVNNNNSASIFLNKEDFEFSFRVAKMLSQCDMLPKHFQGGERGVVNCMVAMDFARSVGANPFMLMKSLYLVGGTIGIDSKIMIALFNKSGRFGTLQYEVIGDTRVCKSDSDGCRAWAVDLSTGQKIYGPIVDWKMVKDEWLKKDKYGNESSKWFKMPNVMFNYRAAAFFVRQYAPEVVFGMHTTEELVDMHQDSSGSYTRSAEVPKDRPQMPTLPKKEDISVGVEVAKTEVQVPKAPQPQPQPQQNREKNPLANGENRPPDGINLAGDPIQQKPQKAPQIFQQTPPHAQKTLTIKKLVDDYVEDVVADACKRIGTPYPLRDPNNQIILKIIEAECEKIINESGELENGF